MKIGHNLGSKELGTPSSHLKRNNNMALILQLLVVTRMNSFKNTKIPIEQGWQRSLSVQLVKNKVISQKSFNILKLWFQCFKVQKI